MLGFTGLRLTGFKSFVEPTELAIEPGLTGVVGPNGCGKSNLIEALRWVMGESSARHMRGGEMDDVIFGGTAGRPARNIAEVMVRLDNARGAAPARFDAFPEIEVTRRIERGQGSSYRINGAETRARDVHLLFADAATGARSSGMVSQGRVGAIINARPADRRSLLEEAAGIGGLHARRHEAEGRLTAASENLTRLDDVVSELGVQKTALIKQAKQAERYRLISQNIKTAQSQALYLAWLEALALTEVARSRVNTATAQVQECNAHVASARVAQATLAATLPKLRQQDAEQAELLRGLLYERETLEAEATRLTDLSADVDRRAAQAAADFEREQARSEDGERVVARIDKEIVELTDADEGAFEREAAALTAMELAQDKVAETDAQMARVLEAVAAADAERAAGLRRLNEAEARRERLRQRHEQMERQHAQALSEGMDRALLTSAEMEVEAAQEYVEEANLAFNQAEADRMRSRSQLDQAVESRSKANAEYTKLKAEAEALSRMLDGQKRGAHAPVLDQVVAQEGWERALAAALGDDLDASLDADAPLRWVELSPIDGLPGHPEGCQPLAHFVTAPRALARRLAWVGVVADLDTALTLLPQLMPGYYLVSKAGDVVRWDGLVALSGAPSPMAVRLANGNRLRQLTVMIEDAQAGLSLSSQDVERAQNLWQMAQSAEAKARDQVRLADQGLVKSRASLTQLVSRFASWESRLAALKEQVNSAAYDWQEADRQWQEARLAVETIPTDDTGRLQVEALRAQLAVDRSHLVETRSTLDRIRREEGDRVRRLEVLHKDRAAWADRIAMAVRHLQELQNRKLELNQEQERLARVPQEIGTRRTALLDRLEQAQASRRRAADALTEAETQLAVADKAERSAEAALNQARETLIRDEAALMGAKNQARDTAAKIAEQLDLTPEQLRHQAQIDPRNPPNREEIERSLDRLTREREAMGPVNLRAEMELAEIDARITTLETEKADLLEAIDKLRHAISELNSEGRERLKASFEEVDAHFRELFVKLFGGGRAHLALVESSDPLQAGLEIMASPPGKRLQILSLLSGGEQALTALALLFAVFMTNPAPICVLDEVDAPLDDANVDRFCSLVAGIAKETGTRFLIVTHHRMTMARMHRLYGVTMAERGVSQLVSVDLEQAVLVSDA